MVEAVESESDAGILGYEPWDIKELLIESAMRGHFDPAMTRQLKDEDLLRAVSLDPKELEGTNYGEPLYIGDDLYTALRKQDYSIARRAYLHNIGNKLEEDSKVHNQISDMLDVELKQRVPQKHLDRPRSILGKVAPANQLIMQVQQANTHKFTLVAAARVKAAMLAEDLYNPIDLPRNLIDFVVHLTSLRGGHAGTTQIQRLCFRFPDNPYDSSSYISFLAQLQEATQLSTITPLEPGEPYRTTLKNESYDDHGFNEDTGTPSNALGIMLPTPPDSFTTTPAPLQPKRDVKGYTINDGPWVYTSKRHWKVLTGKTGEEKDRKITDKNSYNNMIQILKAQTTIVVSKEGKKEVVKPVIGTLFVEIMHTLDAAALKRWTEEKESDAEEEKGFRASLLSQGFSQDDIGEPYHAYIKRSIASEKEKASREHYTEKLKETANERITTMTEDMRKEFFGRYSPAFAQAPFEAEVEGQKERMLRQLEEAIKKIPKNTSGF
ncbi:uncharacterized protein RSE6_09516 [Rhynchosporium secalis]|uniref:Uncharacterized protein n=1 Tax=Rhynchosporium secalis TaxID=38038 RepID=A0A1E1MI30_RHYSE|nr:uncharacterized protein RSE6_09516 [Rhynchosporium secalis]